MVIAVINPNEKSMCSGCMACVNSCPVNAITIVRDSEGFYYPEIKKEKCVDCGMCEKVCQYRNRQELDTIEPCGAFIVQNTDMLVLKKSTSGGFFYSLCKYVISRNGVVYGAILDKDLKVRHSRACTMEECFAFLGSKYVQSDITGIYQKVKSDLSDNKPVCFSGTPCQVAGLFKCFTKKPDNLILLDIVCHGVASPLVWEKYVEFERKDKNDTITDVEFRSKKYGYQNSCMHISFSNRETYGTSRSNPYLKVFYSHIALRPSCYNCAVKSVRHISDFTIFDSWEAYKFAKEDNDLGYTNVIVQTQQGMNIITQLEQIKKWEVELQDILPKNGGMVLKSASMNSNRNNFFSSLSEKGFKVSFDQYLPFKKTDRIVEKLKMTVGRIPLFRLISKQKRKKQLLSQGKSLSTAADRQ